MIDPDTYERLSCGADPLDLADQVAGGRGGQRSPHQASCPSCGSTLDEFELLSRHVDELRREPVLVPERLVPSVMRRIRSDLAPPRRRQPAPPRRPARGQWHPLTVTDKGTTWLSTGLVAQLVERAVGGVVPPPPTGALGRRASRVAVDIAGRSVRIDLSVVAERDRVLVPLARQIRRELIEHVATMTGLEVTEVNITFVGISASSAPRVE